MPIILATQEDRGLKPARAKCSQDPILKNPSQKRAGGRAQGVGPEFKPQYHKRKKEQNSIGKVKWKCKFKGKQEQCKICYCYRRGCYLKLTSACMKFFWYLDCILYIEQGDNFFVKS
jgi:hypothetical protein